MSPTIRKSISQFLTRPLKVANCLDWRKDNGTVLSLCISKQSIDLALASHPSFGEPVRRLQPIPMNTKTIDHTYKTLDPSVASMLSSIVQSFNVCGMIVGWPVEKEGWCGASCGRVLHTLDQLASSTKHRVVLPKVPICLYDIHHHIPIEDEWGRSTIYCETSGEEIHVCSERASQEYTFCPPTALWNDFCRNYWPNLARRYTVIDTVIGHHERHENDEDHDFVEFVRLESTYEEGFGYKPAA